MTIDWWTLSFQAINVLILIWLLAHFFWRPVAAMISERRDAAQKTFADVEAKRAEAAAALADIARTRAGLA
ncbi:MAG: ATPase, partial [Roseiarcus sp.]